MSPKGALRFANRERGNGLGGAFAVLVLLAALAFCLAGDLGLFELDEQPTRPAIEIDP